MTIPQMRRSFEDWKKLMEENLNDPDLQIKMDMGKITRKDIHLWKDEVKRSERILNIIENEPHRIVTGVDGQVEEE